MEEFYDADYLQKTGLILQKIKQASYQPFTKMLGSKIIDLGCGTGGDVNAMAKMLDSSNSIVGIDHNSILLEEARRQNASHKNCSFLQTEAHILPFAEGEISGLRSERLFQHLSHPSETVRELYRVLSSNAPIVIVETDWKGLVFYNALHEIEDKVTRYLVEKKVNNGYASRTLIQLLQDSSFKILNTEIHNFYFKSLKDANAALEISTVLNEALEHCYIDQNEHRKINETIHELDSKGAFVCSINTILIYAQKL